MIDLTALYRRKERAETTLSDPGLVEALSAVRDRARRDFETSEPHEYDAREDAYQRLRAVMSLEAELRSSIAAFKVEERREDMRASR